MTRTSILVVDGERAVRESLRRALELEGYAVELAADGAEALGGLELDPGPDAVLLDLLMPEVDRLEVCRHIRSTGSRIPVLMLTARDDVDSRVAGLEAGADDYLTKPFPPGAASARTGAASADAERPRRGALVRRSRVSSRNTEGSPGPGSTSEAARPRERLPSA